jgi:hypothetical protein
VGQKVLSKPSADSFAVTSYQLISYQPDTVPLNVRVCLLP